MKIKTSELIGPALDWAVAECRGFIALEGLGGCVVIAFDVLVKKHLEELKGYAKGPENEDQDI